MSAKKRSNEFYLRALQGTEDKTGPLQFGLRDVARGFDAKDGYKLKDVASWTPAQKRKVTLYWNKLNELTAQPVYPYKAKSKKMLESVQETIGQGSDYQFKVAFVPHVPKKDKKGRETKPRVDVEAGKVRIRERFYSKVLVPLNAPRMAKNATGEINRALGEVPEATRFTVQAGKNEMPGLFDRGTIGSRVIRLMQQYDGIRALPRGSGNKGDAPKHHKWSEWMHGIIAYEFPRTTQKAVSSAAVEFDTARRELQKRRRADRKRMEYQRSKRK